MRGRVRLAVTHLAGHGVSRQGKRRSVAKAGRSSRGRTGNQRASIFRCGQGTVPDRRVRRTPRISARGRGRNLLPALAYWGVRCTFTSAREIVRGIGPRAWTE
jgi:hypothetical protein